MGGNSRETVPQSQEQRQGLWTTADNDNRQNATTGTTKDNARDNAGDSIKRQYETKLETMGGDTRDNDTRNKKDTGRQRLG